MIGRRFELVGGDPTLDFLNTIHDWTVPDARDYIPAFPDAVRFAAAAGLVSEAEARRLGTRPVRREVRRLRQLRARLERIFRATVSGMAPPPADIERLAREAAEAARRAQLQISRRRLVRVIEVETVGAASLRLRIVDAAIALLTSERMGRVKACPSCGWFFLDTSKNRSRRWCSMATCGSSAKAKRYYWRNKQSR
jgi:predicted RNA-binding Zn ribbon-like protein